MVYFSFLFIAASDEQRLFFFFVSMFFVSFYALRSNVNYLTAAFANTAYKTAFNRSFRRQLNYIFHLKNHFQWVKCENAI